MNYIQQIVTFFGVGKFPKIPGTAGTVAAIPLAALLIYLGPFYHMGFTIVLTFLAIWACEQYEKAKGGHDHSEIVIDEVVGFLVTMTWLPLTWQSFVLGFLLFRLLDIWKPFPISKIDRDVKGGLGVVADDLFAGLVANIILQIIYNKTNWLGAQILVSG